MRISDWSSDVCSSDLQGEDVTALAAHERVRKGIAFVPQLENVLPSLTVEENLKMGGYTLARDQVARRISAQYDSFPRLAERRHQRVHTMSRGARQTPEAARTPSNRRRDIVVSRQREPARGMN